LSDVLPAPPRRPRNALDLIGRRGELLALRRLLDRGERLITLSGGPGFGKSRLARALTEATAREGRWSGGVFEVALGRAAGADPAEEVRLALGLPPSADAGGPDWLGPRLRELGPVLLVLDDVDRAIEATRAALPILLDAAPDLTFIAVSREALGLPGEVRFVLGPLPFDGGAEGPPAGDTRREATGLFADDTAEHLFTIRAEAASPGCSAAPGWPEAVRRLVRRLDGNPLALECAAARMTVLTPEELLTRLEERLAVLEAPSGQLTRGLWEALEEAWEALSPYEQRALARLSILEAPARFEALEAIVGDGPGAPEALDVIDGLARKSLLARARLGEATAPHLFLFESVRSFARTWLERSPSEADDARERLVGWCVAFVAGHTGATASPRTPAARLALLEERELLLGAVKLLSRRLAAPSAAEAAARILVGLDSVIRSVGAPPWVSDVLRRVSADPRLSPRLRVLALITHGARAFRLASWAEATRAFDDALEVAQAAGDRHLEGIARYRRAPLVLACPSAEVEDSVRRGVELLDSGEGGDLVFERAEALAWLAAVQLKRGDLETPLALYAEAIGIMRREGFVHALARTLSNLSVLHMLRDEPATAAECLQEALACETVGDRSLACFIHQNLAECALHDGALESARELLERAQEAARELGYLWVLGDTTHSLSQLAFIDGELEEAAELAEAAREPLARGVEEPATLGLNRLVRALVAAARGEREVAAAASAAADAVLERIEDPVVARVAAIHRAHLALLLGEVEGEAAVAMADAELGDHGARPRRHELLFARRLLEATLARLALEVAPARAEPAPPVTAPPVTAPPVTAPLSGGFVIAADGTWFADPSGEQVSLARKATARRVLARLVADLGPDGSTPLDIDDIFAAGWPGDRAPEPHRSNRVYVLIRRLRNAGLAPVLVHDGEGYRLDSTPGLAVAPASQSLN